MAIEITLDIMLVRRKMTSRKLAAAVGVTESSLSLFKSGKVKGVRFSTLSAICKHLNCQPGDLLSYLDDDASDDLDSGGTFLSEKAA